MKYDAFISYRHLSRDMFVAKGIHKALETTKVPLRIRKELEKKKIERVFRDQEELPIGASLSDNIESALAESEFLVVICSPQTKESTWVMKEIDTFIAMHGRQNILAVLVDGEPYESFPPQLLTDDNGNPREPLAADVRGTTKREISKKIKSESLRLAASILYCDYDTLKQRHRERVMRRYTAIAAGVAVLGVLFGVYNAYNLARINENYRQKLTNESKVLAATSQQVLQTGDRKTAALIALEALPGEGNDRPFVPEAMNALSDALGSYTIGYSLKKDKLLTHDVLVKDFTTGADNTRVLSSDQSDEVYYWNVETGELLFKKNTVFYEGERDKVLALAINDNAVCVVTNHYMTGYDEAGNILFENHFSEDSVLFAASSKSGNYVGMSFRESAAVYDARTGEPVRTFEEENVLYSSEMIFSDDDKFFGIDTDLEDKSSIAEGDGEDAATNLAMYEIATGKHADIKVSKETVMDMFFTPDDCFVTSSTELNSLILAGDHTDIIQKFDFRTGEEIWRTEVERSHQGADSSYTNIKSRILDTVEGKKGEVIVSSSRNIYNLDLYTGEVTAKISTDDDIIGFYVNTNDEGMTVGLTNGNVYIMDADTGYNYVDAAIEVGESLKAFKIGKGYLIGAMGSSPDLVVMSFIEDKSREIITESDTTIYTVFLSPEETNYFYTTKKAYGDKEYQMYVVDSATNKELAHFVFDGTTADAINYIDENTIAVADYDNDISICHIDTGETETIPDSDGYMDFVFSGDRKILLSVDGRKFRRYDLVNKKLVDEGEFSDDYKTGYWKDGLLTNAGDAVYYWDYDGHFYRYDFTSGEYIYLFENYAVLSAGMDKDFTKVVLECGDGYARVANLDTAEVTDEVRFYGGTWGDLEFSDGGNKLCLQGSDLHFRIYDLEKDEFVFISDEIWNEADYIREIPEKNIFIHNNSNVMTIIDTTTYGVLGKIEYGGLYFDEQEFVLGIKGNSIYKFKIKNLEDLINEAKEKYGDAELTPEQRLKYKMY